MLSSNNNKLVYRKPFPKHPFRMIIHGGSTQGKTYFATHVLPTLYKATWDLVAVWCPTWEHDPQYERMRQRWLHITSYKVYTNASMGRLYRMAKKQGFKKRILIYIDDPGGYAQLDNRRRFQIIDKIIYNNRWYNMSIVYSGQDVTQFRGSIRNNKEVVVLFKPMNYIMREAAIRYFIGEKRSLSEKIMKSAFYRQYAFLLIRFDGGVVTYFNDQFQIIYNGDIGYRNEEDEGIEAYAHGR